MSKNRAPSPKELLDRYLESKIDKDKWLDIYQDLYTYVIPNRDAFNVKFGYNDSGKSTSARIWDATATMCAYQRANDLHGLLLPHDRVWGKLSLDDHLYSKDEIESFKPILDEANDKIFYYLNQSNLSRAIASSNLDLVGGTAALWIESVDDLTPLQFTPIPAVALVIEYNTEDIAHTCWFKIKMSGRRILSTFPKYKNNKISSKPNELHELVYGQIKISEREFYLYAFLESDPMTVLWDVFRDYTQILVYRDRVRPGECEGRGIAVDLLPAIKDLNRIVEYSRKSLEFKAYPPIFYDLNSRFNPNTLRTFAGAMLGRDPNSRMPLEALHMPEYSDVINHIQDLRQFIRDGFQVDQLGEITNPVKSATEISIRENRAQRTSATDISRLINELPKQIYTISAKILASRGLLIKDKHIGNINPHLFRFDFQSPLYDLQKQQDLSQFTTMAQILQQFGGEGAVMGATNMAECISFIAEKLDIPAKLIKSKEQFNSFVKNLAQQAQQAQLPTPSTQASDVQFPSRQEMKI